MVKKYLTAEGLEKLKEKLVHLKTVKRREIAERIKTAKELGDLSENAEYQDAKDEQAFNEGEVFEIGRTIKNAVVIGKNTQMNIVEVGNTIKVKNGASEKEFTIVGSNEADPTSGMISNESPIGQALLGKKRGDEVEVATPGGKIKYKILEIS
ncbi:transcription elongation factor GreA [bacterium (Candidatus Torokbacteria) CG09_land_8_20_14_0_10_42_11]|nr:MAG: transcription elongation factor GreA [bacterium (Candidatus Torokbacteria) CG09_land_8_20_14_0_10_42_11]